MHYLRENDCKLLIRNYEVQKEVDNTSKFHKNSNSDANSLRKVK